MKQGPRRLRYIRRLFRDPINPNGQWGLLYLMPGGQAIYDPVAAQKGQAEQASADGAGDGTSGSGMTGSGTGTTGMVGMGMSRAGITPISSFSALATGNAMPGAVALRRWDRAGKECNWAPAWPAVWSRRPLPGMGTAPFSGSRRRLPGTGTFDADSPSEPPIGWQIVGVDRRAPERDDLTFKTYKGKEKVSEWMFHIFDRGLAMAQTPGLPFGGSPRPPFMGPGFGNKGPLGGISGDGPWGNQGPGNGPPPRRGLGNGTGGNGDRNCNNDKP
jgi:hypothetical protein